MYIFSKNNNSKEVETHLSQISALSSRMEQKLCQKSSGKDLFIESLSVEELKDLRQVMMAAEYLLSKYKDKKDIKEFLEEFVGIILHATNSVNILRDDLTDLVISAESALKQIQDLHEDITMNLVMGKFVQTKLDEYEHEKEIVSSPINLTKTTTPVYTQAYLTKTAVEI